MRDEPRDEVARALTRWGYGARVEAALADVIGLGEPGRVVRAAGGGLSQVVTRTGLQVVSAEHTRSRQAGVTEWPVTGDWVVADGEAVLGVASRWSRLARRDPSDPHREQVLVANVDLVACVQPYDRPVSEARLERLAALAWDGGATPFVVLTKADLAGDAQAVASAVRAAMLGVDVVVTSARTGEGLDDLRARSRDRTVAIVGPSGAGKSSLVNALVGAEARIVGEVREGDAKGRHVTTARELIPLPGGGVLVDTPGLRAVGLGDAASGVATLFTDIVELAGGCRFRDCRHEHEPGCAVRAAVDAGDLAAERLERYVRLRHEIEQADLRADPVRARAASRRAGRLHRDVPYRP